MCTEAITSPTCPRKRLGFGTSGVVPDARLTGPVLRAERVRGPVWFVKYRLPDGRQVHRKLGPCVDGAGAARERLFHEAHRRALAARHA
jgi:hypothetical protein